VHSNTDRDWHSATIAKRLAIRRSNARTPRSARNVPRKATTVTAQKQSLSVYRVEAPMNHIAKTVGCSTHYNMSNALRVIQLNVRKQAPVHDSLMNDKEIQDAVVLAIQEPQARRINGRLLTTPMGHHKWTKMVPSTCRAPHLVTLTVHQHPLYSVLPLTVALINALLPYN